MVHRFGHVDVHFISLINITLAIKQSFDGLTLSAKNIKGASDYIWKLVFRQERPRMGLFMDIAAH